MKKKIQKTTGPCLLIAIKQLKYIFSRVDFWIVMITLAAYFSITLEETRVYLQNDELYMGIFSIFPLLIQERDHLFLILIGYLFLVSDAPEFYPGVDMQILRTSRNIWYCSQWIYLVMLTIVYFLLVQLLELVFLFPWISFSGQNPVWEWFSASLLIVLLALFFAGICEVCNLLFRHAGVGVLINALFLFAYLMYANGYSMGFISPVEVYAGFNGSGIAGYICYYIILCTIIFAFGYYSLSRIDIGCRQ